MPDSPMNANPNERPLRTRRHLPENVSKGDSVHLTVEVHLNILRIDQTDAGDYLVAGQVLACSTRSVQTVAAGGARESTHRTRPVLWSTDAEGNLEFVVDVGVRQRLLIVGPTARERALVEQHL
ncbi:MAG: hypothetical protein KDA37_06760, partial [Planctomycetales bacterium]|nr:hypothetical protein [Planctomycetales bacterium]